MDITIDDIDLDDVPGYTPVTKSTPIWKRDMIEKKNQEKIEEYIAMKQREKEEAERWKNVPEWKRKLLKEKEREKETKTIEEMQKASGQKGDYLMSYRREIKEAEEERKARIKEEQERAKEMERELDNVPAWKREIMMKRGGAIKNWGDEREDINEQELEEEDQGYESNCPPQNADGSLERKSKPPPPGPKRVSLDEAKLEDEWESLPLWKREILMKRGGAPTNWGDEREELDE